MKTRKHIDFNNVNMAARIFYAASAFALTPLVYACLVLLLAIASVGCMVCLPIMILQGKKL